MAIEVWEPVREGLTEAGGLALDFQDTILNQGRRAQERRKKRRTTQSVAKRIVRNTEGYLDYEDEFRGKNGQPYDVKGRAKAYEASLKHQSEEARRQGLPRNKLGLQQAPDKPLIYHKHPDSYPEFKNLLDRKQPWLGELRPPEHAPVKMPNSDQRRKTRRAARKKAEEHFAGYQPADYRGVYTHKMPKHPDETEYGYRARASATRDLNSGGFFRSPKLQQFLEEQKQHERVPHRGHTYTPAELRASDARDRAARYDQAYKGQLIRPGFKGNYRITQPEERFQSRVRKMLEQINKKRYGTALIDAVERYHDWGMAHPMKSSVLETGTAIGAGLGVGTAMRESDKRRVARGEDPRYMMRFRGKPMRDKWAEQERARQSAKQANNEDLRQRAMAAKEQAFGKTLFDINMSNSRAQYSYISKRYGSNAA